MFLISTVAIIKINNISFRFCKTQNLLLDRNTKERLVEYSRRQLKLTYCVHRLSDVDDGQFMFLKST